MEKAFVVVPTGSGSLPTCWQTNLTKLLCRNIKDYFDQINRNLYL